MTAFIDGITVTGKPEEINEFLKLRKEEYQKKEQNIKDLINSKPADKKYLNGIYQYNGEPPRVMLTAERNKDTE